MRTSPKISTIIPCFNHGIYLTESLTSVLEQTYSNWECIIIDDGSTDNTSEIAKSFCEKDRRFKYFHQQNQGLSSARNEGLMRSSGNYIQLLDADDIILKDKFEQQLANLLENKADLSICAYKHVTSANNKFQEHFTGSPHIEGNPVADIITRWEAGLIIPCHTVVFKSEFFWEKNLKFQNHLPNHEDWAFWVELFLKKPIISFCNTPLCYYVSRGGSMSKNKILMRSGFLKAVSHLIEKIQNSNVSDKERLINLLKAKKRFIKKKYAGYSWYSYHRIKKKIIHRLKYHLNLP